MQERALPADTPLIGDVREASLRIGGKIHQTPVMTSSGLDDLFGGRVYFKCENLQRIGAFKARGAINAVFSLTDEEAAKGVATHSSGNHGSALALAASLRGIPAWVVVPDNAPAIKEDCIRRYGATVVPCKPGQENRERGLATIARETGAAIVHPYDDWRVIAGQGTAALELLGQVPDLDVLLTPVGGGGLISGTAIVAHGIDRDIRVIGCEPERADDAQQSLRAGHQVVIDLPDTIADGLRAMLGDRNFAVISSLVEDIVTVSEDHIIAAMRLVWERLKIVIEPSAAVPVAALLSGAFKLDGQAAGVIITGGNVDLDSLPWM
ncbi:MAG: pyridoxal-phosphate dependent enzyme [Gammaproteobacteria bacterium]